MRQNLILFAIVLVVGLSACTEDKSMDWKIINDHWFAAHKNDAKFTTPSGLQFDTIYSAWKDDPKPNVNSYVKVNYTGKLVDGKVFDTGTAVWLQLSSAVAGWKEGIVKMHLGAHYIFLHSKFIRLWYQYYKPCYSCQFNTNL